MQTTPPVGDNKLLSLLKNPEQTREGTREAEIMRPVERECIQNPANRSCRKPLDYDKSRSNWVKVIPL